MAQTSGITKGPERIYMVSKNDTGAALVAGQVVSWACDGTDDGIAVKACATAALNNLVAGLAYAADANGDFGITLTYGLCDYGVIVHTNTAIVVADDLKVVSASSCLQRSTAGADARVLRNMFAAAVAHASSSGTDTMKIMVFCM